MAKNTALLFSQDDLSRLAKEYMQETYGPLKGGICRDENFWLARFGQTFDVMNYLCARAAMASKKKGST